MKLVMTMVTRNEDDILEDNIRYHLSQGVDMMIISNHKSTDRTADILSKFQKGGQVIHIYRGENQFPQGTWVSEMARMAYTKYGADWVINGDTDEFWFPEKDNLKVFFKNLSKKIKLIHVDRFDFHYTPFSEKFYNGMLYRESKRKWTKCCHRGTKNIIVEEGNHHAYSDDFKNGLELSGDQPLKLFHFPFRSVKKYVERVTERVKDIRQTHNLPPNTAFHWYTVDKYIKEGQYDSFANSMTYSIDKIKSEVKKGRTVFDNRLKVYFDGLLTTSV